jgi:Pyruvate/2-oxoacid:ferredoxin oxidoreductase gamma subunit
MDDFKAIMTEWLSLKHQLAAARKDMAVLNKREKELRAQVQEHMKEIKETQDVDTVKINQDKVSLRTKEARGSITKNVILAGLRAYFGGDETRVEQVFQAILDSAPVKERNTITVKKSKE